MRDRISIAAFLGLSLLIVLGQGLLAQNTSERFTLEQRGVPLDEALYQFSQVTGTPLAYDPRIIENVQVSCARRDQTAEEILGCLLRGTDLDFFRMSTGTYVLIQKRELAPLVSHLIGVVRDRENGSPISNAHVYLADAGIGAVTDAEGRFSIASLLPGRHELSVSHISYKERRHTVDVSAGMRTQTAVEVERDSRQISPVIVNGLQRRHPHSLTEAKSQVTDQLPAPPGQGVVSATLNSMAGIRTNDITHEVYVQGAPSSESQFRLDGVPIFFPQAVVGVIGPFSPMAIDKITVHSAGHGVVHGSFTSGVIEAEQGMADRNGIDLSIDALSANGRLTTLIGGDDYPRLSLSIAGRSSMNGFISPRAVERMLEDWYSIDEFLIRSPSPISDFSDDTDRSSDGLSPGRIDFSFSDLHASARLKLTPLQSLHVSLYRGSNDLGVDFANYNGRDIELTGSAGGLGRPALDNYRWSNSMGQARYSTVLAGSILANLQVRTSDYSLNQQYFSIDESGLFANGSFAYNQKDDSNQIQEVAMEGSMEIDRGRHHVTVGLEATETSSSSSIWFLRILDSDSLGYLGEDGGWNRTTTASRISMYGEDRVTLSANSVLTGGIRLTRQPNRNAVYAEPRLSFRYDGQAGGRPWSAQTSVGIYRQFLVQMERSAYAPGAILSTIRLWTPLDASVAPPLSYHIAQSFLIEPSADVRLTGELYYKHHAHALVTDYDPDSAILYSTQFADIPLGSLLLDAKGHALGATASAEVTKERYGVKASYAFSEARQQADLLFAGRSVSVPSNVPHSARIVARWTPSPRLNITGVWKGLFGRKWGYRRAYYDYFGHNAPATQRIFSETNFAGPDSFDGIFDDPDTNRMGAVSQFDMSVGYDLSVKGIDVRLRADVLNILDRSNVSEWRLELASEDPILWRRTDRQLYPRMAVFGVSVSL